MMKVKVGGIEIGWELDSPPQGDILSKTLRELLSGDVELDDRPAPSVIKPTTVYDEPPITVHPAKKQDRGHLLNLLDAIGISNQTAMIVANKMFGTTLTLRSFEKEVPKLEKWALEWMEKPAEGKIWALYIAEVNLSTHGKYLSAVGLNEKNQFIILALEETFSKLLARLQSRGVRPKEIKLGVLSFHVNIRKEFEKAFPNADIALDWQEFIDMTIGSENKERAKEGMLSKNPKEVVKIVKQLNGPKELLTYQKFDSELHRALHTTAPVVRIEKDLRSKLRNPEIKDSEDREQAKIWGLMRLQYHWFKIPADAKQLKNLRYIKA